MTRALIVKSLEKILSCWPETDPLVKEINAFLSHESPAQQESKQAWHHSPTVPGLWISSASDRVRSLDEYDVNNLAKYTGSRRWYGPIPEDV